MSCSANVSELWIPRTSGTCLPVPVICTGQFSVLYLFGRGSLTLVSISVVRRCIEKRRITWCSFGPKRLREFGRPLQLYVKKFSAAISAPKHYLKNGAIGTVPIHGRQLHYHQLAPVPNCAANCRRTHTHKMTSEYVNIDSSGDDTTVARARSAVTNAASTVGASARAAADGARTALRDLVASEAPPLQVDWSPLLPRSQHSLTERVQVARSHVQPWREFASAKALSFPTALNQIKSRYARNVTRFFYNYIALALADIAISGVFHRVDAVITLALIVLLYVAFEDDIVLLGGVTIGSRIKAAVVTVSFLVTLVFGGVIPYVIHSLVVVTLLFAIHGILRETENQSGRDVESAAAYPDDAVVFDANNPMVEATPPPTDF